MNSRVRAEHGHICSVHSEVCCCIVVLFDVGVKAFIKNRIACKLDSTPILLCLAFVRQSASGKLQPGFPHPPPTHDDIVAQHFFPHFFHSLWRCFYEPASSTDKDTDDMHTTMLPNADDSDIATKSSLMMMLPLTAATAAAAAYERRLLLPCLVFCRRSQLT